MSNPIEQDEDAAGAIKEPRLWRDNGWTARVIKNEDDDGWAVEMTPTASPSRRWSAPGPWGATRRIRSRSTRRPSTRWSRPPPRWCAATSSTCTPSCTSRIDVTTADGRISVTLDIVPDEDDPYAMLTAIDRDGVEQARQRVAADFRLSATSAAAWIESGYRKPG